MKSHFLLYTVVLLLSFVPVAEGGEIKIPRDHCNSNSAKANSPGYLGFVAHPSRFIQLFSTQAYTVPGPFVKSSMVLKQKLDSLVIQVWNENSTQKIPGNTEKFLYDSRGNVIQFDSYDEWDEVTKTWVSAYRNKLTYNEQNQVTENIHSEWIPFEKTWLKLTRMVSEYGLDGKLELTTEYSWNEIGETWDKALKRTYETSTTGNGKVITELVYGYDEQIIDWQLGKKIVSTYDVNGKLMLEKGAVLFSEEWIDVDKTEYIRDANGYLTEMSRSELDFFSQMMQKMYREVHSYNGDKRRIMTIEYELNESGLQLVESLKLEFSFDTNGNLYQQIESDWDSDNSVWVKSWKQVFNYNNAYSAADLYIPDLFLGESDYFNHMVTTTVGSSNTGPNEYSDEEFGTLYYSEQNSTATNGIEAGVVNIYPNPVSELLSFSFSDTYELVSFELFDVQGHKIMQTVVEKGGTVPLEGLSKGMYFYRLDFGGTVQNGKLIKK